MGPTTVYLVIQVHTLKLKLMVFFMSVIEAIKMGIMFIETAFPGKDSIIKHKIRVLNSGSISIALRNPL